MSIWPMLVSGGLTVGVEDDFEPALGALECDEGVSGEGHGRGRENVVQDVGRAYSGTPTMLARYTQSSQTIWAHRRDQTPRGALGRYV